MASIQSKFKRAARILYCKAHIHCLSDFFFFKGPLQKLLVIAGVQRWASEGNFVEESDRAWKCNLPVDAAWPKLVNDFHLSLSTSSASIGHHIISSQRPAISSREQSLCPEQFAVITLDKLYISPWCSLLLLHAPAELWILSFMQLYPQVHVLKRCLRIAHTAIDYLQVYLPAF